MSSHTRPVAGLDFWEGSFFDECKNWVYRFEPEVVIGVIRGHYFKFVVSATSIDHTNHF